MSSIRTSLIISLVVMGIISPNALEKLFFFGAALALTLLSLVRLSTQYAAVLRHEALLLLRKHERWLATIEIMELIGEERFAAKQMVSAVPLRKSELLPHLQPDIGGLHIALDTLVKGGLVERREAELSPGQLRVRGGKKAVEWRAVTILRNIGPWGPWPNRASEGRPA